MKPEKLTSAEIHDLMPHVANEFEHKEFTDFAREVEAEVNKRWEAMLSKQEHMVRLGEPK